MQKTELCFISQDGAGPSGVTRYGETVLEVWSNARLLLLNSDEPRAKARIVTVPTSRSHDPEEVADVLRAVYPTVPQRGLALLPNHGDTPWEAAIRFLEKLDTLELKRTRLIGILHSDTESQYALFDRYGKMAPVWCAVSRRIRANLSARCHNSETSVTWLPTAIKQESTPRPIAPPGPIRLVYGGRLDEPQKRVSRLPLLAAALDALDVDFSMAIAGTGPEQVSIEVAFRRLPSPIANRVQLLGMLGRPEMFALWRRCDVCLLTSAYEGQPLAVLEAMAAGACPVAMSTESGLAELIENGVNGRLVSQGDIPAMARAIALLAADRRQLAAMSKAARQTVGDNHGYTTFKNRLQRIVSSAFRRQSPQPGRIAPDPARAAVASLAQQAAEAGTTVAIFGAGMFGRKMLDACLERGLAVIGLYDSDPNKAGFVYRGYFCRPAEELASLDKTAIIVASLAFSNEMQAQARELLSQAKRSDGIASTVIALPRASPFV